MPGASAMQESVGVGSSACDGELVVSREKLTA